MESAGVESALAAVVLRRLRGGPFASRAPRSVIARALSCLLFCAHGLSRGCGDDWAQCAAGACLRLFVTCVVVQGATDRFFRYVDAFANLIQLYDDGFTVLLVGPSLAKLVVARSFLALVGLPNGLRRGPYSGRGLSWIAGGSGGG